MKPVFPASYSTLSSSALASLISEKFGKGIVQCKFLLRGVGDTYLVESPDDRFILRVYRSSHRSLPQIEMETSLLLALKQSDIPVSYPLEDLLGEVIQALETVEGVRHAVLFTFAPGKVSRILNEKQLRIFGHQMARFHNVSSTLELENTRWSFDFETTLFKPLEMLAPYFAENHEDYTWLQQAAKSVSQRFAQLDTSEFSAGYCHFDFLPKNFHFEGDSITFFDFDFMGYGWLLYDLTGFWQHLCLDVYAGRMTQAAADDAYAVFIDAYTEHRSLSKQELEAVPYLSLGFWLFYMGFHTTHDQFLPFIQPGQLKFFAGFLRHLVEKHWSLEVN